jgi:hypothetical protein
MKKTVLSALLLSIGLVAAPAMSQVSQVTPESPAQTPMIEQSSGIEYINGGAGFEARDEIAAVQSGFPLRIVFSGKGGEYVVADTVTVRDQNRELLRVKDAGPLLMVNLPPGKYTIEASYLGKPQTTTIALGREVRTLNWNWPGLSDSSLSSVRYRHFDVGITNSAPLPMLAGQRCMIDFCRV